MDGYPLVNDINGLGSRLNNVEKECAACKADKAARLQNIDMRQDSQRDDIKLLFSKLDEIRIEISSLKVQIALIVGGIQVAAFIVGKVWH